MSGCDSCYLGELKLKSGLFNPDIRGFPQYHLHAGIGHALRSYLQAVFVFTLRPRRSVSTWREMRVPQAADFTGIQMGSKMNNLNLKIHFCIQKKFKLSQIKGKFKARL